MKTMLSRARIGLVAAAMVAFAIPALTPSPAAAWWYHRGWGWHTGGYGWHPGWYGWHRGCCWGPGVVVGVAPPVVAALPVFQRAWIPAHWNGPYWVPGHWS